MTPERNVVDVQRVGVVGGGLMGAGIAEVCARAGLDVVVYDVDASCVEAGRRRIDTSLRRAVARGKLAAPEATRLLDSVTFTPDLGEMHDRDLVIEAVIEDEVTKTAVFAKLDSIVTRPD